MLKRLLDLMGEAEVTGGTRGECGTGAHRTPGAAVSRRAIGQRRVCDFGDVSAYAINEGVGDEKAYILGTAFAESMAQGNSNAYAIVYAAAYGIACSVPGESEEWARAYAQACAHASPRGNWLDSHLCMGTPSPTERRRRTRACSLSGTRFRWRGAQGTHERSPTQGNRTPERFFDSAALRSKRQALPPPVPRAPTRGAPTPGARIPLSRE